MARRSAKGEKRPGRLRIKIERVVLGAIMSVAVVVVERRLRKALGFDQGADDVISKTVDLQ